VSLETELVGIFLFFGLRVSLETELVGIFLYVIFTACWVLFLICLVLSLPVVFAASWIVPVLEIFVF
jgi:hypothetical protein